jgi:hypothetical protein
MPDLDNDGAADLLYVTGNVYPEIERRFAEYPHRGPRIVFRNRGGGVFADATEDSGPGVVAAHSSRGAAFGDYDQDGDVDVLVMNMNERPSLLRNDTPARHSWLEVKLQGTGADRFGLGATIIVAAGGRQQARAVLSQTSYYSVDDLVQHFGLGMAERAERLEVRWPSGVVDVLRDVPGRRVVTVREGATQEGGGPPLVLSGLDGRPMEPLRGEGAKALVFVFVRTDCPVSNRYVPELRRLQEAFAPRGVVFRLVYTDPGTSPDAIRSHLAEYGLGMGALRDPGHALVAAAGAKVTPEAAVFVPAPPGDARLVYHGRIDDRYAELGKMRPAPTSHELRDALAAVLSGRPVPRATAPAVGCFIADVP